MGDDEKFETIIIDGQIINLNNVSSDKLEEIEKKLNKMIEKNKENIINYLESED